MRETETRRMDASLRRKLRARTLTMAAMDVLVVVVTMLVMTMQMGTDIQAKIVHVTREAAPCHQVNTLPVLF